MKLLNIIFLLILIFGVAVHAQNHPGKKSNEYQIGVYYFPDYHVDKRNETYFGKGWTEWKLIKEARPRFKGHQQPKVPLWGYTDEADPKVMAQKISAAASHGIDAFIFDWYYYNDGPFLQRGLEDGFMHAPDNKRIKFAIMWANHDYTDIFPYTLGTAKKLMYPGKITAQTWDRMTDYIIAKYFKHPSYWLIDGEPYFSIYDLGMFINSFGSIQGAKKAIEDFRIKTRKAGFPDLHLNAVAWGGFAKNNNLAGADTTLKNMGFNSVASYVWYHHGGLTGVPATPYDTVKKTYFRYAQQAAVQYGIPYYPNVTMGWDPSPRTNQNFPFKNSGYPHTPIIVNNTPATFEAALKQAKAYMDKYLKKDKILTINAWNEWTEGSYLEPDTLHKLGYLDAIKNVFGKKDDKK